MPEEKIMMVSYIKVRGNNINFNVVKGSPTDWKGGISPKTSIYWGIE